MTTRVRSRAEIRERANGLVTGVETTTREAPSWGAQVTEVRVQGNRYAGGVHHLRDGTFQAFCKGVRVGPRDGVHPTLDAAVQALVEYAS